jgi:membrane-associated phospholipid phosphatase
MKAHHVMFVVFVVLLLAAPVATAQDGWPTVCGNASRGHVPECFDKPAVNAAAPKPVGLAQSDALMSEGRARPVTGIEPGAGAWRTWVLASGSELRLEPPPDTRATKDELRQLRALAAQRDAAALDQISYWDSGSPSYRWIELALNQLQAKPMPPHRGNRIMSLLNVTVYDAMVATWDSKYTYDRRSPADFDPKLTTAIETPNSPSYPSEHAVAAGAAAAILGYAFPDDAARFDALAEEAGQSRLLAGVSYPSDVSAGLELGRAVAAKVIARAQADGSDAQWTGTVPVGPGLWVGTNPVEPLIGTWKPWVLSSGDQFRPGPPLAYDSAEKAAELAELHAIERTFPLTANAFFNQSFDGLALSWYDAISQRIFEHRLDENPPRAALIYVTMAVAQYDAVIACFDAKYAYWAIRPSQLDPTLTTLFPPPNHPSYPAAHGCVSTAIAVAQAHFFPRQADYIIGKANEAAYSRMVAGIHYRSDVEVGIALGRRVAEAVLEAADLPEAMAAIKPAGLAQAAPAATEAPFAPCGSGARLDLLTLSCR